MLSIQEIQRVSACDEKLNWGLNRFGRKMTYILQSFHVTCFSNMVKGCSLPHELIITWVLHVYVNFQEQIELNHVSDLLLI